MSSPTVTDASLARPSTSTGSITLHETDDKASTLVQSKDKSSIRRWFNVVRQVVFSDTARKQSEASSRRKKLEEALVQTSPSLVSPRVVCVPYGASKEDITDIVSPAKVEPAAISKCDARDWQASSVPVSASASASAKVDLVVAPGQAAAASTILPDNIKLDDDEATSTKSTKARLGHKPRGPTMITPAVLQKIAKHNKKHQGASFVRDAEVRKSSTGAVSSTSRAKGVQASPMRWSQD
jgi:hypothetical protein